MSKYFYEPLSSEIKIIDFGGATFEDDYHTSIINTRQYRAPEVILRNSFEPQNVVNGMKNPIFGLWHAS